jgi:hypothetical protein
MIKFQPKSISGRFFGGNCVSVWHIFLLLWPVFLKLILNHQESRCTENNNIVKFRALFGEASLHKKGKQQNCLLCVLTVHVLSISQYRPGQTTIYWFCCLISSIFFQKCHKKICWGPKKLHYCAKQLKIELFGLAWLIFRTAMLWFPVQRLSWWFSISFSVTVMLAITM